MAEISATDLEAINNVGDIAAYVGMTGTAGDDTTYLGAFYKKFGLTAGARVVVVGLLKQPIFEALVDGVRVSVPPANAGEAATERGLTPAELGAGYYFGRVARVRLGLEAQVPQANTGAQSQGTPPQTTSAVATRKVKLTQVLSQLDETEVDVITEAEQIRMYARFETLFGKGQRPLPQQEPTIEQLSGLKSLVESGQAPFADFAIFQPYGARMMKRIKFAGMVLNKAGGLMQAEIYGPIHGALALMFGQLP
eukprot:s60_g34.t1